MLYPSLNRRMATLFYLLSLLVAIRGQLEQLSPLGLPILFDNLPTPTATNCPYHPATVDLPNPLPDSIINNVTLGLQMLKQNVLNSQTLPGIAYSLTYKDKVLFSGGLGVTVKNKNGEPNGTTIFRIGSVSKVFAVMVLYQLFDRGVVKSLDDDIKEYCPDFKMQTQYNITLRQLASQLSGLPREAPCGTHNNLTSFCATTTKNVLNNLQTERTLFPPWTRPSYSNLAYSLLGHCLVEHYSSSMTYEDYVQQNILAPLKMSDTGFKITDTVKARMATGYAPDGSVAPLTDLGWLAPAGQMYSTTNDLNKLAQFFMDEYEPLKAVLSTSVRQQMLLPMFVNRDRLSGFGTPWEVLFQSNYTVLIKGGNVGGYTALFSFIPELKLGLNVLLSGQADEFGLAQVAHAMLIPVFVEALRPLKTTFPYPPNPSVYEGTYKVEGDGIGQLPNITIGTFNKHLVLSIFGVGYYLSYQDKNLFQIQYDDNLQPCLISELTAAKGEWLYFSPGKNNAPSPLFTIPGLYVGINFVRIS